jgi:hypothetical protein
MKKTLFVFTLFLFSLYVVHAQQFEGYIEIKTTRIQPKSDKKEGQNIQNDMMKAGIQAIQDEIKKKEEELKSKSKDDEDYKSLEEEIKIMKEQLKSMGGNIEAEKPGEPITELTKFFLKGDKYRVESADQSGMGGSFILNLPKKNMIIIMEKEKKYAEVPFSFFKDMMKQMKSMGLKEPEDKKEEKKESGTIKVTGEKKTILGYACEKWIFTDNEKMSEAWLTLKFTNLFGAFIELGEEFMGGGAKQSKGMDEKLMKAMADKGAFPLAVTEKDKDGKIIEQWEVTKLEKKTLSNDLFDAPKGYEKFDMMQMFQDKK